MRSPADMDIIVVDITNKCHLRCGACTRMVAHQPRFSEMTVPQVREALVSIQEWRVPGKVVGIIGGEPTLHSQFEEVAHVCAETIGRQELAKNGRQPILDLNEYVNERLHDRSSGRGLWTSLGPGYARHFEIIQDVFDTQTVNTHENPGLHKAILITRKEVGIPDEQWIPLRDACWVQNMWSASINHHGAYFCEVAANLDNLYFQGKHAWKVEPGWWKRTPDQFGDQLDLCEYCACAIPTTPSVQGNHDTDLVSPVHRDLLVQIGSPAIKKHALKVVDPQATCSVREPAKDWYMPSPLQRVGPEHSSLLARRLDGIVVSVGCADQLAKTLTGNRMLFDTLVVVTTAQDAATQQIAGQHGCRVVLTDALHTGPRGHCAFNKGNAINDGFLALDRPDWVLFFDADISLHHETREFVMQQYVLNPGCLYYVPKVESDGSGILAEPRGYFQLWNPRALSIRGRLADDYVGPCSEHFCSAGGVDTHFSHLWPSDKRILLYDLPCKHWTHEERWNHAPARGWRQVGMLTVKGLIPVEGGLTRDECLLLLTDTSDPERQEVVPWRKGTALPPETMRVTPEGEMVFLGKNIGKNHLHVAQWFEKGVD